ncbi:hypothetical protein LXL04_001759 [Taraxacum kok-saghyz]
MFILLIFILIFSLVFLAFNKKRVINNNNNQPPAIIAKDLLIGSLEPVFESLTRQLSSREEDTDMGAKQPPKQPKVDNDSPKELSLEDDMHKTRIEALSTPSSPRGRKSNAMKISCLCAPTNHPGSFRCRYHRNSVSVGSNLSELAYRKTASLFRFSDAHDTGNHGVTMYKSDYTSNKTRLDHDHDHDYIGQVFSSVSNGAIMWFRQRGQVMFQ